MGHYQAIMTSADKLVVIHINSSDILQIRQQTNALTAS